MWEVWGVVWRERRDGRRAGARCSIAPRAVERHISRRVGGIRRIEESGRRGLDSPVDQVVRQLVNTSVASPRSLWGTCHRRRARSRSRVSRGVPVPWASRT